MRWSCIIIIVLWGGVHADTNAWSSGTAHSLPKGQWETGLFQPVRYGLNDDQDIALHPFFALKLPNLVFKKTWTQKNSWTIASQHGIYYPTPLLNYITGAGKFKIVSPQFEFPALIGFTKSLAREVGQRGVTVNAVAPGFIDTAMTRALSDSQQEAILQQIPLNRMGNPEDIAHAVEFLASENAAYITGSILHVNGGMY